MKTVGDVLRLSIAFVKQNRPRREVEEWIASTLGMRRLDLYLSFDKPLTEAELSTIRQGIVRLARGEPLAYLHGIAPFYGLDFAVSPDVLIPRPETEILVQRALAFCQSRPPGTIIDVCTGSGCIGLTLKTHLPDWSVELSDISPAAVAIAKKNAELLNVQVAVHTGDLLNPFLGRAVSCLVCNPPYLSSAEWESLDCSVKHFEPRLALEGGPRGIELYCRLIAAIPAVISSPGLVLLECSPHLIADVFALTKSFPKTEIIRDLSGRQRVIVIHVL